MRSRPKALVVLSPAWPAQESETSWVTTQQLFVRTLQHAYPALRIIILTFYYPYRLSTYQWNGIDVHSLDGMRNRKWRRPFFYWSVWRKLRRIRRENEVTGLLSFWCGECALAGHYFGRWNGIPHHCWLCGQDARAGNRILKLMHPRSSELVAMSDFLRGEFERNHGIRPEHMIPNGIDPAMFVTGIGGRRDIDVLGAGSLSPLKRYDLFVEVIRRLKEGLPGVNARHCGSGTEEEYIRALILEYGMDENVLLLGEQDHAAVLSLMQRTKVFLHPSSYEGFGVVCLEALYAGAQVISFSKPLDQDIPGWHIVENVEQMSAKALELLSRPQMYEPVLVHTMKDAVQSMMQLFKIYPGQQS